MTPWRVNDPNDAVHDAEPDLAVAATCHLGITFGLAAREMHLYRAAASDAEIDADHALEFLTHLCTLGQYDLGARLRARPGWHVFGDTLVRLRTASDFRRAAVEFQPRWLPYPFDVAAHPALGLWGLGDDKPADLRYTLERLKAPKEF